MPRVGGVAKEGLLCGQAPSALTRTRKRRKGMGLIKGYEGLGGRSRGSLSLLAKLKDVQTGRLIRERMRPSKRLSPRRSSITGMFTPKRDAGERAKRKSWTKSTSFMKQLIRHSTLCGARGLPRQEKIEGNQAWPADGYLRFIDQTKGGCKV